MAKAHLIKKLEQLSAPGIENIIGDAPNYINKKIAYLPFGAFKVLMALADDALGGWTNRFTTDYDSKFKLGPMIKRKFCNVLFWISELIHEQIIKEVTLAYCYGTIYQVFQPEFKTLAGQITQEKYVALHVCLHDFLAQTEWKVWKQFYEEHKENNDFPVIFNFLYGDAAAKQLGYAPMDIEAEMAGFKFAGLI